MRRASWGDVVCGLACLSLVALGTSATTIDGGTMDPSAATLEFERHYELAVGDQGEDRFELPHLPPSCDGPGVAFDSAEIVYLRRRFGEAQVVATPEPGCVRCGPIIVRRYHEPTGELSYLLRVHRRVVTAACADPAR